MCDLPSNAVLLRGVERGAEVCTRTRGQRALTHSFRIHSRHICVKYNLSSASLHLGEFRSARRSSRHEGRLILTHREVVHDVRAGFRTFPKGQEPCVRPKKTFSSLREFGRHGPNRTLARARARALSQIMQLHRWKCHVGTDPICAMQAESPRKLHAVACANDAKEGVPAAILCLCRQGC